MDDKFFSEEDFTEEELKKILKIIEDALKSTSYEVLWAYKDDKDGMIFKVLPKKEA